MIDQIDSRVAMPPCRGSVRLRRVVRVVTLLFGGSLFASTPAAAEVPGAMSAITAGDCGAAGKAINEGLQREDPQAYFLAGFLYDRTGCVASDPVRAGRLYRKAASMGDPEAPVYLGFLYGFGRGVPQDYVRAHRAFDGADVDTAAANVPEETLLGYVETVQHLAELQVGYPTAANAGGIEATLDVVLEPNTGAIAFERVKVGKEIASNVSRPYAFTGPLEDAYRSAIAMAPKPVVDGAAPVKYLAHWQFRMREDKSGAKVRLQGYATVGPASAVP